MNALGKGDAGDTLGYAWDRDGDGQYDDSTAVARAAPTANADRRGTLAEAAGLSMGAVLAALAAVRRGRAFHPDGVVYDARLAIARVS
jgi:hypothetical protein